MSPSSAALSCQLLGAEKLNCSHLYGAKFCHYFPSLEDCFVTVGGRNIFVCKVNSKGFEVLQHHFDDSNAEDFWACCWASTTAATPVVAAAGQLGIIRIISILDFTEAVLKGHGDSINELAQHPSQHHLLFSASKDRSVRLWHLQSMVCVAIFGGDKGHKDDVLCVDVHMLGNVMASSSVDTTIKIWNLREPALLDAIAAADRATETFDVQDELPTFRTLLVQAPLFSTDRMHRGYVDSAKWFGDALLTKSTNHRMVLWAPDASRYVGASVILQEYHLKNCNVWFLRSDVCPATGLAAVGNNSGKVLLYSVGSVEGEMEETPPLRQSPGQEAGSGEAKVRAVIGKLAWRGGRTSCSQRSYACVIRASFWSASKARKRARHCAACPFPGR